MSALIHIHSGLRWVALILLLVAIINALTSGKKGIYEKKDKLINLFSMIIMHVQLLVGFVLYFTSPKVSFADGWMKTELFRFYGMEHLLGMILAITLITIGRRKAENTELPADKHKKILVWYSIGLLLIVASIPWPFREALAGQWF
jgi:hypothetical protein